MQLNLTVALWKYLNIFMPTGLLEYETVPHIQMVSAVLYDSDGWNIITSSGDKSAKVKKNQPYSK